MSLIGTYWVTFGRGKSVQTCTGCRTKRVVHKLRASVRFLTGGGIPMVPLGRIHPYRQCTVCNETFPEGETEGALDRSIRAVLLEGTAGNPGDVQLTRRSYQQAMNRPWPAEQIQADRWARGSEASAAKQLRRSRPYLRREAREEIVRTTLLHAAEDGQFDDQEQEWVLSTAQVLGVSTRSLRDLIDELS